MSWEGKKVRFKVGKGSAVGTVTHDRGSTVVILTEKGKSLIRKTEAIVSEEQPEPASVPSDELIEQQKIGGF